MNAQAKKFCFRIIYTLVMEEYNSKKLHDRRQFNPNTFLRRSRKNSSVLECGGPYACLLQLTADGYLLQVKSDDYNTVLYQVTKKFKKECYKQIGKRFDQRKKKDELEIIEIGVDEDDDLDLTTALNKYDSGQNITLTEADLIVAYYDNKGIDAEARKILKKKLFHKVGQ